MPFTITDNRTKKSDLPSQSQEINMPIADGQDSIPFLLKQEMAQLSSGNILEFTCYSGDCYYQSVNTIKQLILAGWTGRHREAVEKHIQELEAIGVSRPISIPTFYQVGANLLTTNPRIQVIGNYTSGEVEAAIVSLPDGLWLGIGSDLTDRYLERQDVTLSKQICPKPIGPYLWKFDDIIDHWDKLIIRSFLVIEGKYQLYQEGMLSELQRPETLIQEYVNGKLPVDSVMFCGTIPRQIDFIISPDFVVEIQDPIRGKKITHKYTVEIVAE